jgi:hypothetical protein
MAKARAGGARSPPALAVEIFVHNKGAATAAKSSYNVAPTTHMETGTMKNIIGSFATAVGIAASCGLLLAAPAHADEQHWKHEHHGKEMSAQDRQAGEKKHLDHEATMLEIKASQQAAWDTYAAAKLDLVASFGAMMKPATSDDLDAAAAAHKHADHAAEIAQKLAKLADATDKLQAVLSDDQRKVLNRMAKHHGFGQQGHHDGKMCDMMGHEHEHQSKDAAKAAAKTPPAKAKQP